MVRIIIIVVIIFVNLAYRIYWLEFPALCSIKIGEIRDCVLFQQGVLFHEQVFLDSALLGMAFHNL